MKMQKTVFVVMPFGVKEVRAFVPARDGSPAIPAAEVDFNEIYEELISPALIRANCKPFRADKEKGAGDIRTDMFYELVTADIILADISILNPNVFYELGIRHGAAPRGVLMMFGGWAKRPFDIAPDRTLSYDGMLFEKKKALQESEWKTRLQAEIHSLSKMIEEALDVDDQTIGSPVYKELSGLEPADWSHIGNARAKYFGNVFVDWKTRIKTAKRKGFPGDIITLADDAPTRFHRVKFLSEAARCLIEMFRLEPALHVLDELLPLFSEYVLVQPKLLKEYLAALAQKGLVLGRLNRLQEAEIHLSAVVEKHAGNPELQGILGRIYKDMWRFEWDLDKSDLAERQKQAVLSSRSVVSAIRSYNIALRQNLASYYNGINVVSLVKILEFLKETTGEEPEDHQINDLSEVIGAVRISANMDLASARAQNRNEDEVWPIATLAELELAAGDAAKSKSQYRSAVSTPNVSYFQLNSMLSQIRIFERLGFRPEATNGIVKIFEEKLAKMEAPKFRFGKVAICSGHMIDLPDRKSPRFPPEKEDIVRQKMEERIDSWKIGAGDLVICGGARGTDILFAEICLKRSAEVWLLIALPLGDFLRESVRIPGSDWEDRFFKLETAGVQLFYQQDRLGVPPKNTSPFARNNLWIINSGLVESSRPGNLHALLVWDEKPTGDGPGGTSDFAARVENFGGRKAIINPTKL